MPELVQLLGTVLDMEWTALLAKHLTSLLQIVGGVSAKKGEFPFLALIGEKKEGREVCLPRKPCYVEYENRWNCGGNIINTRWILTAAHWYDMTPLLSHNMKIPPTSQN